MNNTDFLQNILEQFEDLKLHDRVCVIRKDKYKGCIGTIDRIYKTPQDTIMYTIELESTGNTIDRPKYNIKKYF